MGDHLQTNMALPVLSKQVVSRFYNPKKDPSKLRIIKNELAASHELIKNDEISNSFESATNKDFTKHLSTVIKTSTKLYESKMT